MNRYRSTSKAKLAAAAVGPGEKRKLRHTVIAGSALALGLTGLGFGAPALAANNGNGGNTQHVLACSNYNVSGAWTGNQDGTELDWQLSQSGQSVTGTAVYNYGALAGTVSGTVIGSAFDVVVTWSPTLQGEYTATVTPTSLTNGNTHPYPSGPGSASWSATGSAACTTPTTADSCKGGGWTALTDASATPFKNQGDCVSYASSGGKNTAG